MTNPRANAPAAPRQLHAWHVLVLTGALIFHVSLLVSWRTGLWNRYTFDSVATHGRKGWDFYALYQAGYNARHGISVYSSDEIVTPVHTPYRYGPLPALTLGALLSLLPPVSALWVWAVTIELVLVACCIYSWRLAPDLDTKVICSAMWLCYTPYYLELYLGQFTLVLAAGVLMLMNWFAHQRPLASDLLWSATLLWKPMTVLLAPVWAARRRWRGIALAAMLTALTTLPYLLAYPDVWGHLASNLELRLGSQLGNLGVLQLWQALFLWLSPDSSEGTVRTVLMVWSVLVVLISLVCSTCSPNTSSWKNISLWLIVFYLVSPDVWEHHYVLLVPVFIYWHIHSRSKWVLILYAAIALWTPYRLIDPQGLAAYDMSMRWLPLEPLWLNALYHACKAVPVLIIWGTLLHQRGWCAETRILD
ncbi:MAG: DUF2029 domain-containing protein [Chloroflexi bacterium]|nr:DUF2029 domain-containing protein [Chloroflexota bacterium]